MRSVLIPHWHRESKKKPKNKRGLPVKARSERVRSNYSIRVKWILGNIRGRLPNNLWSSCNCIQILQAYRITLFFWGCIVKTPVAYLGYSSILNTIAYSPIDIWSTEYILGSYCTMCVLLKSYSKTAFPLIGTRKKNLEALERNRSQSRPKERKKTKKQNNVPAIGTLKCPARTSFQA